MTEQDFLGGSDPVQHKEAMLWLDLETTGLDPNEGAILEACAVLTDMDLNEIRRKKFVIGYEREDVIGMMDDYVLEMHLGNGLLKEVWAASTKLYQVDEKLADLAQHHNLDMKCKVYLAGSSIHFDRAWVKSYLPKLDEVLHYRMIDVSSFTTAFPGVLARPKSGGHRAEADIDNSISIHRELMSIVSEVKTRRANAKLVTPVKPSMAATPEEMEAYEAERRAADEGERQLP